MSDSSSVQLYYAEETTWGEDPTVQSPLAQLNEFRFTSDSLAQNTETTLSEEIRSDRQVSDIIRTAVSAGGDVGFELSYGSHDDLIAGALADDWSTLINETGVTGAFTTASPGPGSLVLSASPIPSWINNVEAGMFLQITTAASPEQTSGYYKVASVDPATGTILFTTAPPVNEPAGTFAIKGQFLRNGVTRKSFLIEKFFGGVSDASDSPESEVRQYYTGMRVGSMSLTIAPGAIINGSMSFQGKQAFSVGATVGNGTPQTVSSNDVMNAVDNIRDILVNGVSSAAFQFTNVEINLDNSLRDQPVIGQLANSGIGLGRTVVSGTIEAYLVDRTFLDYYLNFDTISLSFRATLGGNNYVFDFPSIKLSTGTTETGGNDQDVLASVEFNAKRDPVSDFTIGITRFPA